MSNHPFMKLWIGDLVGDTMHLDDREFGAYIRLLIAQFNSKHGALPNDNTVLARIAHSTPQNWHRIKGVVLAFFKHDANGNLYHPRVLTERHAINQGVPKKKVDHDVIDSAFYPEKNAKSLKRLNGDTGQAHSHSYSQKERESSGNFSARPGASDQVSAFTDTTLSADSLPRANEPNDQPTDAKNFGASPDGRPKILRSSDEDNQPIPERFLTPFLKKAG
jgi:uncharacterized protein YdaU (DUF1376 family)